MKQVFTAYFEKRLVIMTTPMIDNYTLVSCIYLLNIFHHNLEHWKRFCLIWLILFEKIGFVKTLLFYRILHCMAFLQRGGPVASDLEGSCENNEFNSINQILNRPPIHPKASTSSTSSHSSPICTQQPNADLKGIHRFNYSYASHKTLDVTKSFSEKMSTRLVPNNQFKLVAMNANHILKDKVLIDLYQ